MFLPIDKQINEWVLMSKCLLYEIAYHLRYSIMDSDCLVVGIFEIPFVNPNKPVLNPK